jgi:hypothetical protein
MIELKINGGAGGSLVAIEDEKILDRGIRRVFYLFGMGKDAVRGKHANRNSTICFIALKGRCTVAVDNGLQKEAFTLDAPNKALVCDPMTWKEMNDFSSDCILLGICDTHYEAAEYITDYETFRKEVQNFNSDCKGRCSKRARDRSGNPAGLAEGWSQFCIAKLLLAHASGKAEELERIARFLDAGICRANPCVQKCAQIPN